MAENKKISEMPFAESLSGSELIPIVQGGGNKAATADVLKGYVQPDLSGWKVKDAGHGLRVDDNGVISFYTDQIRRGSVITEADTTVNSPVLTFMSYGRQEIYSDNRTYVYDGTRDLNPEAINLITEKGLVTVLDGYKVKNVSTDGLTVDENGVVSLNMNMDSFYANTDYNASTKYPLLTKALYKSGKFLVLIHSNLYDASRDISPTALNLVTEKALAKHLAEPNMALFIDLWKQAVGTHGTYNAETGFFELNGLTDITYEEAKAILELGKLSNDTTQATYCGIKNVRTVLYPNIRHSVAVGTYTFYQSNVEVLELGLFIPSECAFAQCPRLREIKSIYSVNNNNNNVNTYKGSTALESIKSIIRTFPKSFSLEDSPLLDIATFQRIVEKKYDSDVAIAMTITVHPDVYAKLTDETNTEWHKVLTDAAAKNISFATTE